jgi:hypothetical protein
VVPKELVAEFITSMRAIAERGRKLDLFDTGIGYGYTRRRQEEQQAGFKRFLADDVRTWYQNGFRKLVQANARTRKSPNSYSRCNNSELQQ